MSVCERFLRRHSLPNIRAALKIKGQPIGAYAVLIAGTALARGLVIVTSNVGEFQRIGGLQVEDWRYFQRLALACAVSVVFGERAGQSGGMRTWKMSLGTASGGLSAFLTSCYCLAGKDKKTPAM